MIAALLIVGCGGGDSAAPGNEEIKLGETGATAPPRGPTPKTETEATTAEKPAPPARSGPRRPAITQRPIPFDAKRVQQTAAYSQRHYGEPLTELTPKVIVEHFTVLPNAEDVISLFGANKPDVELKELPGVCSHFLIDRDGTILQLVPVRRICRHTVGLNDVAIGIEHVGASDSEVTGNTAQLKASLALTAWLRCRYDIGLTDVIGHAESLSSPYHHEGVARLKRQTHDDFQAATMERYRSQISSRRC